jgi:hypothetical protein
MMGECFCGAVAFAFDPPVSPIELCHCTRCQRATGSPFAAEFRVASERFRWLRGEEMIAYCDAPLLRDPPAYRRSFCSKCGSQVPSIFPGHPNVAIPTGLVTGDLPTKALRHIWIDRKASWLDLGEIDQLPRHEGDPP